MKRKLKSSNPVSHKKSRSLIFAFVLLFAVSLIVAAAKSAHAPRTNVLLITMDTLRADHVSAYGAKMVSTPAVDSLAADGTLYENAFSQVPLTWPSHTAIMTGTYPFQNGVQDFTGQPLAPQFETIAQALGRHGYRTGAVVSSFVLDRSWGLARGFDFYDDAFPASEFEQRDVALVERPASDSIDHAINWLKQDTTGKPFFLWLHLYDPHSPYNPPEPFATEYKTHPYDGEVAYADAQLARLIGWLKNTHQYENTLIIFVADHGESLGEHGENEHGFFLYNATTRIPLVMKPAGKKISRSRLEQPVETVDIAPTILKQLDLDDEIAKQFQGHALATRDNNKQAPAYNETFYPLNSFGWSPLRSVENAQYHYIDAPHPELYDVKADPGETHNIYGERTAVAAEMKRALDERVAHNPFAQSSAGGSAPGMNPETSSKLQSLGYLAYKSPAAQNAEFKNLPDPKDKIGELNAILQAGDAFHANDFQKGAALLHSVQSKDPNMYLIPFMLGEAELRQSDWQLAKKDFERALQLNPHFDQAMTGAARAAFQTGDQQSARDWLQKALKENPQNFRAWYELAWMDAKQDPAAAEQELDKTLAIQPNFGLALRDLGMLQYSEKQFGPAADNLAKAAENGAADAKTYNALGICYRNSGNVEKAIASYQQALKLDSSLAEAHINLGFAYATLGRQAEAQQEYHAACSLNPAFCRYAQ